MAVITQELRTARKVSHGPCTCCTVYTFDGLKPSQTTERKPPQIPRDQRQWDHAGQHDAETQRYHDGTAATLRRLQSENRRFNRDNGRDVPTMDDLYCSALTAKPAAPHEPRHDASTDEPGTRRKHWNSIAARTLASVARYWIDRYQHGRRRRATDKETGEIKPAPGHIALRDLDDAIGESLKFAWLRWLRRRDRYTRRVTEYLTRDGKTPETAEVVRRSILSSIQDAASDAFRNQLRAMANRPETALSPDYDVPEQEQENRLDRIGHATETMTDAQTRLTMALIAADGVIATGPETADLPGIVPQRQIADSAGIAQPNLKRTLRSMAKNPACIALAMTRIVETAAERIAEIRSETAETLAHVVE